MTAKIMRAPDRMVLVSRCILMEVLAIGYVSTIMRSDDDVREERRMVHDDLGHHLTLVIYFT